MSEQINLRDNPHLDSEAMLLSAAMWSRDTAALKTIGSYLTPTSFYNPLYGQIFEAIASNVKGGKPVDPATIRAQLVHEGLAQTTSSTLVMLATLGANDLHLRHYAVAVSSQAYRRSYHELATSVADAAARAPESTLFDHLVDLGRQQRSHWNAHCRFCEVMGCPVDHEIGSSTTSFSSSRMCAAADAAAHLVDTIAGHAFSHSAPITHLSHSVFRDEDFQAPATEKAEAEL